jgi:hypothetical protein
VIGRHAGPQEARMWRLDLAILLIGGGPASRTQLLGCITRHLCFQLLSLIRFEEGSHGQGFNGPHEDINGSKQTLTTSG